MVYIVKNIKLNEIVNIFLNPMVVSYEKIQDKYISIFKINGEDNKILKLFNDPGWKDIYDYCEFDEDGNMIGFVQEAIDWINTEIENGNYEEI